MEPRAYPVDLDDLANIWHTFMESGRINRRQESLLDPNVLQSWRRCMSRLNPNASSHTLALVMSAARAISSQLQADWSLEEANHRLLEVNTVMSAVTEGVIAWNTDGDINHVNAKACEMLNLNSASVLGLSISQLLDLPKVIQTAVRDVVELHNAEVMFRINDRAVRSLVSLRPIIDGSSLVMGYIMRLGGIHPIAVDVQIIAATSEDLEQRVAEGGFLSHLYYRFGVFNITIPPLRQRAEDLPLLAERFFARITERDSRATCSTMKRWQSCAAIHDQAMSVN